MVTAATVGCSSSVAGLPTLIKHSRVDEKIAFSDIFPHLICEQKH